jgi:hypothetical protein
MIFSLKTQNGEVTQMRPLLTGFSAALLLTAFSVVASAITVPNAGVYPTANTPVTAGAFGVDDWDYSTLNPYPTGFVTTSNFLAAGQANFTPLANNTWNFTLAQNVPGNQGGPLANIPGVDLTINMYSAWAVINDPVTDIGGTQRARPMNSNATRADTGGADFEMTYTPNNGGVTPNDPTTVSFLQIAQFNICASTDDLTCTWGTPTTIFDNLGSNASPFYVQAGGIGGNTGANSQWLFDIPYLTCENSGTPNSPGINIGPSSNCRGGTDGVDLAWWVRFETFVAIDNQSVNGPTTTHNVVLYGGRTWGFDFVASDTPLPEPGGVSLVGIGLAFVLAGVRRYRSRLL